VELIRLRLIVGYLGEKGQSGWWPTEFYGATSNAFLSPVFGKTAELARYNGVLEAARRLHDEHIGVGQVFHLFRFPAVVEQSVYENLIDNGVDKAILKDLSSKVAAFAALQGLSDASTTRSEGPIQIGELSDLGSEAWIGKAAACYLNAFQNGTKCFPYLTDRK
jgi:hypothetical protein